MGRQRIIPTIRGITGRATGGDRRIAVPIAPAAGIAAGAIVAIAFLLMPIAVLEDMAVDSGVAALLTAAQPPLGTTARLAAATLAALAAGTATWFGIFLLVGTRTMLAKRQAKDGLPVLRRADAHPDAPPRRPVFAHRDLGTPFLEVKAEPVAPVERDLPIDLDTPMANHLSPFEPPLPAPDPLPIVRRPDPIAPSPMRSFVPLADIEPMPAAEPEPEAQPTAEPAPRFAAHERIETFVMPPVDGTDPTTPLPQATIHDLLARLERGVARQQPEPAPATLAPQPSADPSLEETLATLRALARRVG